jgi:preprotein translocase subunit SecG
MKIAFIVVYLVIAIAMITFIMLQRGTGAAAGSGFGSGASGTVFGARGSANFLSKATKWLAVAFFVLSMGMAVYETRIGTARDTSSELGVMSQLPVPAAPAAGGEVPAAPEAGGTSEVPSASTSSDAPTAAPGETPAAEAPAVDSGAPAAQTSETPATDAQEDGAKPQ